MKKALLGFLVFLTGCATTHAKPCSEGGQPARDPASVPFEGSRHCTQAKDASGKFVNDGLYYEWYSNDSIAMKGQYKLGKKEGRWIEYDRDRKIISDKYFKDGKEIDPP